MNPLLWPLLGVSLLCAYLLWRTWRLEEVIVLGFLPADRELPAEAVAFAAGGLLRRRVVAARLRHLEAQGFVRSREATPGGVRLYQRAAAPPGTSPAAAQRPPLPGKKKGGPRP